MNTLAIETSCDETAVALLNGKGEVLASEIASQIDIHRVYGGVVPEVASRNHLLKMRPVLLKALEQAQLALSDIDVFAATAGPGLAGALLIGNTTAKTLALAHGKPFVSVNHLEGHLLSPFMGQAQGIQPCVALVVSGGHINCAVRPETMPLVKLLTRLRR
jgi:N6-L-threonylcarbamoyladenine synthase